MNTYTKTLAFLYSQLPQYQNIGSKAYKADLSNIIEICKVLGNPHQKIKTIHVAGSNGKGSVSHMLASILHESGYRVGLYTSPHLKDFRERIKINGQEISEEKVTEFVQEFQPKLKSICPSFFEWTVGLAFYYFSQENTDVNIIETGLGGRLDSTNIITPEVSVITNISLEHTAILGDSIDQIAREKAGIIKPGIPVVIGKTQPKTKPIFDSVAKEKKANIYFADQIQHQKFELDLNAFDKIFNSEEIKTLTRADFHLSQQLGIKGFPSLILKHKGNFTQLSNGYSAAENIQAIIAKVLG